MSQRDDEIVKLSQVGLSARKIQDRLSLHVSRRQVQRVIRKQLGPVVQSRNAETNALEDMKTYVVECLRLLGKDPHVCEICLERQERVCDIHHTKYEGATIYDLQYVCRSCNLARAGQGIT